MKELIERLERATEGSRELDRPIAELMGTIRPPHEEVDFDRRSVTNWPEMFPPYTTSIDAALTLVPEGMEFEVGSAHLVRAHWAEVVWPAGKTVGKAPTPALALCIAAIRARSKAEE